ncbi:MAG: recombination protein RecR, partial [Coriobacteriales bacterium]|nr:recombination protein RecR [Coriobacteriales bacterium]
AIARLQEEFERLPGIGPKSAQRIVYWLLNNDSAKALRLADAIREVKQTVHFCPVCFNYAEGETCDVCADALRDVSMICVVEEPKDIASIERTHQYKGLYHVLGGVINPMEGVTPNDLHIRELMARLASSQVHEVLIATNSNVEGETTASYLARLISPLGIRVTRLASGLPVGSDLEFADEVTLGRAIEARREL